MTKNGYFELEIRGCVDAKFLVSITNLVKRPVLIKTRIFYIDSKSDFPVRIIHSCHTLQSPLCIPPPHLEILHLAKIFSYFDYCRVY